MNEDGDIQDEDFHLFKAYEDDIAYVYLYHLMSEVPVLYHIFLKARKIWYSGEFGMLHELVPASVHTANMVTEIIHELDLAFQHLAGARIAGVDPGTHFWFCMAV